MLRVGRLKDGLQYIEEWLGVWEGKLQLASTLDPRLPDGMR